MPEMWDISDEEYEHVVNFDCTDAAQDEVFLNPLFISWLPSCCRGRRYSEYQTLQWMPCSSLLVYFFVKWPDLLIL